MKFVAVLMLSLSLVVLSKKRSQSDNAFFHWFGPSVYAMWI